MLLPLYFAVVAMLFTGGAAAAQATSPDSALDDPSRPIRWVVPQPPGGASDTMARVVGQKLAEQWERPIVIDNRPGANGIIGANVVAKSAPNGLTWLNAYVGNHATNASFYKNLPFDPAKDFAAVATLGVVPYVVVVNSSLPVANLQELIALAKKTPNQLIYGGPNGSVNHLLGVMLNSMAGIDMRYVPYKVTIDAVIDTVAGRIQVCYGSSVAVIPFIRSGKLRALAVTSAQRSKSLQAIPTIAESGYPDFDVAPWFGILVRAGTPTALIRKINADVNKLLMQKEVVDRFAGAEPLITTPEQFAQIVRDDIVKWAKVIKDAGIRAE